MRAASSNTSGTRTVAPPGSATSKQHPSGTAAGAGGSSSSDGNAIGTNSILSSRREFFRFTRTPRLRASRRRISVELRALSGETRVHERRLEEGVVVLDLELPTGETNTVHQVTWEFDFTACDSPQTCSSGKLISVRFRD